MHGMITGVGMYVPEKVLTNKDLEKMVDTSDEWIVQRTGVRERRIVEDECTSDLAVEASKEALEEAGISPENIDAIIVATITPDTLMPATALHVQRKLGVKKDALAFDVNAACSGFIYALSCADAFISAGMVKNCLVIGAETLSRFTDWQDRTTCVLFGDGAGAVVLQATDTDRGILASVLHANGDYADLMVIPGGGAKNPCSHRTLKDRECFIKMKGQETFKMAVKHLVSVSKEALEKARMTFDDVDFVVCHQANLRILQSFARFARVPQEKVPVTLDIYGNTSGATIPLTLGFIREKGLLKEGNIVLLNSFGASLTWAASVIRW